jgi:hypothetical protein
MPTPVTDIKTGIADAIKKHLTGFLDRVDSFPEEVDAIKLDIEPTSSAS